ncbi:type II secretion system GspH family protein [Deltaproteobacteria bacterium]|nr:type II secretion system GspH family protein [Deltaproteobacteria bacterium]
MMKRQAGFTMVELLVTVAITGILMATAMPVYHTWQQRAYGSEAAIMIRQILDAEILYYLENDKFYPDIGDDLEIWHGHPPDHDNVTKVSNNLNIIVPTGHFLDYYISSYYDDDGVHSFHLSVSSLGQQFDIVEGVSYIAYKMDKDGNITVAEFPE